MYMNYSIVEKEAFRVIGKTLKVSIKEQEHQKEIPKFWGESNSNGTCEKFTSVGPMPHAVQKVWERILPNMSGT